MISRAKIRIISETKKEKGREIWKSLPSSPIFHLYE
jgi:hypothetical protein